ncbi:MAG: DUF4010 domain-containing protein [Bacteroidota bacterium]
MPSGLFLKLLLSLVFGATIGLERESDYSGKDSIGGIRTFALISLSGSISGLLFLLGFQAPAILIMAAFLVMVIIYYFLVSTTNKDFGMTNEMAAIITYVIGLLLVIEVVPMQITVAIFVVLIFLLSIKSKTTKLVAGISRKEMQSFISYAIITLLVLPVLPDQSYKLQDIPLLPEIMSGMNVDLGKFTTLDLINPQKIWLIVVLITGIDVFGYILGKIVGDKSGFALTSFIAGFVSSTSATQSLAQRSKNTKFINHLIGAAVLANLASFLQIFLLVGPLNAKWLVAIVPAILLMVVAAGVFAYIFLKKKEPEDEPGGEQKPKKIFSLIPAIKFAGLLISVKIVTKVCLILFGQSGFVISSIIASFAGIDAILVNLADMAGDTITFKFAFLTFILVNATNLASKTFYSFLQGKRSFALRFMFAAIAIIGASSIWLIFI